MKAHLKFILLLMPLALIPFRLEAGESKNSMMLDFEKGFRELDQKIIEELYVNDAVVISKGVKTEGNIAIAKRFREKGMEKVNVEFTPTETIQGNDLMYERGIFKDYDKKSGQEIGKGDYFVLWKKDNNKYKIKLHTWSDH